MLDHYTAAMQEEEGARSRPLETSTRAGHLEGRGRVTEWPGGGPIGGDVWSSAQTTGILPFGERILGSLQKLRVDGAGWPENLRTHRCRISENQFVSFRLSLLTKKQRVKGLRTLSRLHRKTDRVLSTPNGIKAPPRRSIGRCKTGKRCATGNRRNLTRTTRLGVVR